MDALTGRSPTTKGIWIAKCLSIIEPCTIVLDLEGTDQWKTREDDKKFENQMALFALTVSDIILINLWCHDIGLKRVPNISALKTLFQVMIHLFCPAKKTILFVIRDKTKTPLEFLEPVLREHVQTIWDSVAKSCAHKDVDLTEFFNVEVTALPSFEEKEEHFKEQVELLRNRFMHSIAPGGLARDRRGILPASGFSYSVEKIWKDIKENKDLNLPAHKVKVATFMCEMFANDKFRFLESNEWLELSKAVQSGLVPGFGKKLAALLDALLSEYDMEAVYFDEGVRTAERQQLESRFLRLVHPAFLAMLGHLRSKCLAKFKSDLEKSWMGGRGFVASFCDCAQFCLLQFDQECSDAAIKQADWDASSVREKLQRDIEAHATSIENTKLSELMSLREGAHRRSNALLPPPWAVVAIAVLGFNELMMLLRNPLYLLAILVTFLVSRALWIKLDITREFQHGTLLPRIINLLKRLARAGTSNLLKGLHHLTAPKAFSGHLTGKLLCPKHPWTTLLLHQLFLIQKMETEFLSNPSIKQHFGDNDSESSTS